MPDVVVPWRQVEIGKLTVSPFGGRIVCHVCLAAVHQLKSHVGRTHHMSAEEYRARFGLPSHLMLVSPALRRTMQRALRDSPLSAKPRSVRGEDVVILDGEGTEIAVVCQLPMR
jgi:predicted transcriptional regulator